MPSKAVAVLELSGQDAEQSYRRVLVWFAGRWRNHQSKRAEKPHSKSSGGDALDGPATRPETPLAVENSVGKLAALEAPNASMGKRAWRTPIPHFGPCLTVKSRAGAFVFPRVGEYSAGFPAFQRVSRVFFEAGRPGAGVEY